MRHHRPTLCYLTVLISWLFCLDAIGLPVGYKEDYNGCARNVDKDERELCCRETHDDCSDQCNENHKGDSHLTINCLSACLWATMDCQVGDQIQSISFPGHHLEIPGVMSDGDQIKPNGPVRLTPALDVLNFEVHNEDSRGTFTCLSLSARCACPQGTADTGVTCRPILEGNTTQCQICTENTNGESCVRCKYCRPIVQAVHSCEVPEPSPPAMQKGK